MAATSRATMMPQSCLAMEVERAEEFRLTNSEFKSGMTNLKFEI